MQSIDRRVVYAALFLALFLAGLLRFWNLGALPPGLYHDEAYNGLDALSLIHGKTFPQFYEGWELYAGDAHVDRSPLETRYPVFFEGNYGREPLHIYLMALSILLFDVTPFAIRAVPAAAGTLAVLTTFLATRALFRSSSFFLPLFAAFTMAVLYPSVHFSRFGIRAMVFVPVETLVVACYWAGIHRGQEQPTAKNFAATWLWFLLAGVLLGLSLYTFAAARLFPLVWVLFVPAWFLLDRKAMRRFWKQVLGMAGAAFTVALPLIVFFVQYPYFFIFRIAYVANKGKGTIEGKPWLTWFFNTGRVVRGLVLYGETHLRHNLPGRPFLDVIQSSLLVVGLVRGLRNVLRPRYLFLFIWFAVMLLPSILSGDAPHFGRLSGISAPVSIIIALGAQYILRASKRVLQRRFSANFASIVGYGLIAALFLASAFFTIYDYFYLYARHPELAEDFYRSDWDLGMYAAHQGQNADIYLTPTQEELATIMFALADPDALRNFEGSGSLLPLGKPGTLVLYLVRNNESVEKALENLNLLAPGGSKAQPLPGVFSYQIAEESPRNRTEYPADSLFGNQIRLIGWSKEIEDDLLTVTLAWQAETEMNQDYTVFVHLIASDGRLGAQLDRQPDGYPTSDWRKGEIVIDRFTLQLPEDYTGHAEDYSLLTGFYYLPTLERLGEAVVLEDR